MIFFIPAGILAIIGYFIKYKHVTWLISGYNTASQAKKETYDLDKLCPLMGNFIFMLASIVTIMAILILVFPTNSDAITIGGFALLAIFSLSGLIYLNNGKRILK